MRKALLALGVVVIATFAAISSNAQQAGIVSSQQQMPTKFEYRTAVAHTNSTNEANDMGRQGWELVSVVHVPSDPKTQVVMYFKKPVR